jgi:hypothetical protein
MEEQYIWQYTEVPLLLLRRRSGTSANRNSLIYLKVSSRRFSIFVISITCYIVAVTNFVRLVEGMLAK